MKIYIFQLISLFDHNIYMYKQYIFNIDSYSYGCLSLVPLWHIYTFSVLSITLLTRNKEGVTREPVKTQVAVVCAISSYRS